MSELKLTFGVGGSDRVRALVDGTIKITGVAAEFTVMPIQDLFNLQLTKHAFDSCEFPVGTYLRTLEQAERPYVAIPVFPSCHFRLSCVFVNKNSRIREPADLAGRRVGIPVFDMAAAVWLRGIFADHFSLDRTAPIYVTGGLERPRTEDEHPQHYPAKFRIEHLGAAGSLAEKLQTGEIDALYTARAPSSFYRPSSNVVRLFEDPVKPESEYFRQTGIFPPMHLVCIKRPICEANPGIEARIFEAFSAAQAVALDRIRDSTALSIMLPWLLEHLRETQAMLGDDFWPIGLRRSRPAMQKLIEYMRADDLIRTDFQPEQLFPPGLHAT
jgi:4,5-dihydroxyphthalate decarboxylase